MRELIRLYLAFVMLTLPLHIGGLMVLIVWVSEWVKKKHDEIQRYKNSISSNEGLHQRRNEKAKNFTI